MATITVTTTDDTANPSTGYSLRSAIVYAEQNAGTTIQLGAGTYTLTSDLPLISQNTSIVGDTSGGTIIDGAGAYRGFTVAGIAADGNGSASIDVGFSGLTIQNVVAQGGAGTSGGGGGLGAGGAVFVGPQANVTLTDVDVSGATAVGGSGGNAGTGGGGGGLGGSGGGGGGGGLFFDGAYNAGGGITSAGTSTNGGAGLTGPGGSDGNPGAAGSKGGNGSPGGAGGAGGAGGGGGGGSGGSGGGGSSSMNHAGSGGDGGVGGDGGFGGGGGVGGAGGGPGTSASGPGGGASGADGGNGGFAGGGGGGGAGANPGRGGLTDGGAGGSGGFGGGGGAGGTGPTSAHTGTGGNGGFGGGGGDGLTSTSGGFGGGSGAANAEGGGGGGAMGGAIFVASGGTLTINGASNERGGVVTAGAGLGGGTSGSASNAGIFYEGGANGTAQTLTFGAGSQTWADSIGDLNGAAGNTTTANGLGGAGGIIALTKSGGGILTLKGTNTFTGGTTIAGGTIDLAASYNMSGSTVSIGSLGTGAISFHATASQTATLALESAAQPTSGATFANQLADFGTGDALDLKGFGGSGSTFAAYSNGKLTVSNFVPDGSGGFSMSSESFDMSNPEVTSFRTQSDGAGGTLVTTTCYASGTLIRTTVGDAKVEALATGNLVVTSSGEQRPIKWLGHRTIDCRNHPRPHEVMPVRIAAHAFGPNKPARDLYMSPGHSICLDVVGEVLIPAIALVNGATIAQVEVDEITYWHVELDSHDILLAENLPAESYLDMGNRAFFAENDVVVLDAAPDISPDADPVQRTHADYCRPFHLHGPLVEAVRAQMRARALALGWRLSTALDAHLEVDGTRVDPVVREGAMRFLVPAGASDVWLVSPAVRPSDTLGSSDARPLGIDLRALKIDDGFAPPRAIAIDDPRLDAGFSHIEDGHRWTAGRARLPAELWAGCENAFFLRVDLGGDPVARWVAPEIVSDIQADVRMWG